MKTKETKKDIISIMWFSHLRFCRFKSKTFIKKTSKELKMDLVICNHLIKEYIKVNREYLLGLREYKLGLISEFDGKYIYSERMEKNTNIIYNHEMKTLMLNKEKIKNSISCLIN